MTIRMKRSRVAALLSAVALSAAALLIGTFALDAHAATTPTPTAASTEYAYGGQGRGMNAQPGGGNWNDGPSGDGATTYGQGRGMMDGRWMDDGRGEWQIGDIFQWIAIAALAGFAVGLMIWRPWKSRLAPAGHATPAGPGGYAQPWQGNTYYVDTPQAAGAAAPPAASAPVATPPNAPVAPDVTEATAVSPLVETPPDDAIHEGETRQS